MLITTELYSYLFATEMMSRGAYQVAIEIFDEIIRDYPNADDIYKSYHHKGHCLGKLKRYHEAIECNDTVLLQHKNTATMFNKAYALYKLKKYEDSLNVLDSAIDDKLPAERYISLCISFRERVRNKIDTLSQSIQNECTGMEDLEDVVPFGTSIPYDQNQTLLGSFIDMYLNSN